MLLGLASTVNSIPLPPISDRHGVRLPPQEHCLTNVNFSIVPNPMPEGYDEFEEQPAPSASRSQQQQPQTTQTTAGQSTQDSELFDSNRPARQDDEDDDYDDDDGEGAGEDGDVSMTTVQPTQSTQSQGVGEGGKEGEDEQRGVKRSLDEDEEYD